MFNLIHRTNMMKEFFNKVRALFNANMGAVFAIGESQYAILRFCGGSELYDLQKGEVVKIDFLTLREVAQIVSKLEELEARKGETNE